MGEKNVSSSWAGDFCELLTIHSTNEAMGTYTATLHSSSTHQKVTLPAKPTVPLALLAKALAHPNNQLIPTSLMMAAPIKKSVQGYPKPV